MFTIYDFTNLSTAVRFKLHLLLKDETGETKVMLLDTIAEPILGISAEVLLNGSLEEVCIVSHLTCKLWFEFDNYEIFISFYEG